MKTRKERIGIFGGTFNPIHNGHLRAASAVRKRFSLDRVLFVPSYIPPHKETDMIASPDDRMKMVELALRGRRRFVASPIEIRARGTSYSILTLNRIKKLHPDAWIFFILGVDAFRDIKTWRAWRRVLGQCLFIVMTRPGFRLRDAKTALGKPFAGRILETRGSAQVREDRFSEFGIFLVPFGALDISSTGIRECLRAGNPLAGRVPRAVEKYIQDRGLYVRN